MFLLLVKHASFFETVITSKDLQKHGNIWVCPVSDHVCTRFFFVWVSPKLFNPKEFIPNNQKSWHGNRVAGKMEMVMTHEKKSSFITLVAQFHLLNYTWWRFNGEWL